MSQLIQTLHKNNAAPKGFLKELVLSKLNIKLNTEYLTPCEDDIFQLIIYETLGQSAKLDLTNRLSKIDLLSPGIINPKTAKTLGLKINNFILHLTPSDLSNYNLCPSASAGCRASCLNGAGRGLFDGVQLPRLRKTLYFVHFRAQFLAHLVKEIEKIEKQSARKKLKTVIRLNGTSDISWELFKIKDNKNIFELFPNVQFYDYTKVVTRLPRVSQHKNYSLTFSASESNWNDCEKALTLGFNVATVFDNIPATYKGFTVINGDDHDFRYLDKKKGCIVGLRAKGPAKKDISGFVKRVG